jgi:hypothetical protein
MTAIPLPDAARWDVVHGMVLAAGGAETIDRNPSA